MCMYLIPHVQSHVHALNIYVQHMCMHLIHMHSHMCMELWYSHNLADLFDNKTCITNVTKVDCTDSSGSKNVQCYKF